MMTTPKPKLLITILIIIGILAGVVVFWPTLWKSSSDGEDLSPSPETLSCGELCRTAGWEGYAHPSLPFAFAYPKDLTPSAFTDGGAEIVARFIMLE